MKNYMERMKNYIGKKLNKNKENLNFLIDNFIFKQIIPFSVKEIATYDSNTFSQQVKNKTISGENITLAHALALESMQTKEKVLSVGYTTCRCLDPVIESQTAAIFLNDHSSFSKLKIRQFFPIEKICQRLPTIKSESSVPDYLITTVSKDGLKERYFVKGEAFKKTVDQLILLSQKSNQGNFYSSKSMFNIYSVPKLITSMEYWSDSNWDAPDEQGNYYDKINDVLIIESFQSWLETVKTTLKPGEPLRILSPGAGKGRLDEKLIQCLQQMKFPFHYTLIEPSKSQIDIAEKRLSLYSEENKIDFLNSTLEEAMPALKTKFDCIVLSGGPVNMSIVSPKTAKENAMFLQDRLNVKGKLLIAGLTPVIPKPKDFPELYCEQHAKPLSNLITEDLKKDPFISQAINLSFFGYLQSYVYVRLAEQPVQKNGCNIF